ncbi:MAG: ketoacyl-ACP synthase III [Bdellovibrionales bacterium]|nr:ketoacyl-ACP synthase III [Bdellovibrionales bacterium]
MAVAGLGSANVQSIAELSRGSAGILGTGSALPKRVLSNKELSQFLDTTDEWILDRVGIATRHVAGEGESTVDLAYAASQQALAAAGLSAQDIDLILFATVTGDQLLPSAAALLQDRLGASGCMAFDLAAACSGFLFGLTVADSMQRASGFGPALVIGSENLSRMIDWTDRQTCVLFGDGAGAVVYDARSSRQPVILASDLHTDGNKKDLICRPGCAFPKATLPAEIASFDENTATPYVQMRGREVFKSAVTMMCDSIEAVLAEAECTIDDVKLFVPHQSNKRMVEAVCDRIGLTDWSRVAMNIERVGNTSAASIPIALHEAVMEGGVERGDLVLMTAVGAGITYGSVLLRW